MLIKKIVVQKELCISNCLESWQKTGCADFFMDYDYFDNLSFNTKPNFVLNNNLLVLHFNIRTLQKKLTNFMALSHLKPDIITLIETKLKELKIFYNVKILRAIHLSTNRV